jgi:plasmid stabilization system protein ParE
MSHAVHRHRIVRQDLAEVFYYLGRTRVSSAHRFLREVEKTFQHLAGFPGIGARYQPDDPLFAGLHNRLKGILRKNDRGSHVWKTGYTAPSGRQ